MSYVSDLRLILRGRDFRRLFGTRLVSQFSDGIFQFGVAGMAFFSPETKTSAVDVAMGLAVLLLPYSVLGPFAGVFIDRWSRRQILVIAPVIRATLLLVAAGLLVVGAPDVLFYGTALCVLGVNRFFLAALGASLPHVVPKDRLMVANAVTPTSGTVITFVGVGMGFALRQTLSGGHGGTAAMMIISGVVFGLSALIASRMERSLLGPAYDPCRPQVREALRNVVRGLIDGARHIAHRRAAAAALGAMSTHRFMYGMCTAMMIMLYRYHFYPADTEAAVAGVSLVLGVSGVGYFLAALITPWATERFGLTNWVPIALIGAGVLAFALASPIQEWLMPVAGFVLGLAGQSVKICADTVVQRDVEDAYLGRVFSIYDMLFNGVYVAAAAFAALLLPADGRSLLVVGLIGLGYALGGVVYRMVARTTVTAAQSA
ncbi:MFS-type transporter involved in bile tolerance, Atg22 family [Sinosporangium album]|uniref:MFS-type transporter involved in bile tolerance, Atg22 family n=1 Tax=Sinosporangium album TaxID=504805 RepID=A0A1G8ESN2_9ACTN|nr:MFS transporter [Sinosporangium album]SDH72834.1 MFS-type transporter involved in bile tolerance, Atg22 family [Sinosporangium album]